MCNRIQGRTPVFGSCLVLILRCCVSDVDKMDMRFAEVELCQILVSEVELGTGLCGCGFVTVLWYLRWTMVWDVGVRQSLVSEVDPLFFVDIVWDPSVFCYWSGLCWCRRQNLLWSMILWVMASMMNYLIKNISKLFIVLYDHIAIYSKLAWPTFSKADTETDCSSQKLHMFRHGFPLPSLSTGWPGFGGKRIGFAF